MKVLFLDHDGVICLSPEWGTRYKKQRAHFTEMNPRQKLAQNGPVAVRFDNFNKKAIAVLNSILEETGAEIVVSSDWTKQATVEEMGEYYEQQGIIRKPIAFTPNLQDCTVHDPSSFIWSPQWDLEQVRSIEIKQYLHDHPEVTHWVAVDDLNMSVNYKEKHQAEVVRDWGLTNFVLTPKCMEGIKQSGVKDRILNFLV